MVPCSHADDRPAHRWCSVSLVHTLRLNTCLSPSQHRRMLKFSTRCRCGCLTVELECHRLERYTRARNRSSANQLPHWCKLWQARSRLLGCMQVTVETHTVDIEATAASGRDRLQSEPYLVPAADRTLLFLAEHVKIKRLQTAWINERK